MPSGCNRHRRWGRVDGVRPSPTSVSRPDRVVTSLRLSAALSSNPLTRPLLNGEVSAEGIDLVASAIHPSEMFWRQLRFFDFDISEMSLSSLAISRAAGDSEWTALPIFTTRRFFHTEILVRADVGIDEPSQLKGKRVGVAEYQQTAAVWSRGALAHEFGVMPADMIWFMERNPGRSHGGATGFTAPEGVRLEYVPENSSLGDLLAAGDIDAALTYITNRNLIDRTRSEAGTLPGVRTLFPDQIAEGVRYYRKTLLHPINHCVVVRTELYRRHPWIALNLFSAFVRSKEAAIALAKVMLRPWAITGEVDLQDLTSDPLPFGFTSQRHILETLMHYIHEQGLTPGLVSADELFAVQTIEL